MPASLSLLVGTTKGAFVLDADSQRQNWTLTGPHCDGWSINHVVGDPTSGTIWAGGGNDWFGAGVWRSDDHGATWTLAKLSKGQMDEWAANDPDTAAMFNWEPTETQFDGEVDAIWSLHRVNGTLYAGGKPANLFESADNGESWTKNAAIADFEDREDWTPGAAGLVLHSIVTDPGIPKKLWLGVSAAGVFASEDGGTSFERRNRLSNADAHAHHHHPAAPKGGETGHCVHNVVRAPGNSDVLYQQNHHGVFRSRDGGRSWDDATTGLPSTFGFPIAVHPRDPDMVWTLPLNGDIEGRFPPNASAAVWKSSDGGETWRDMRDGLPQRDCFFTVLRQSMATDKQDRAGVYFGTNSGSVFASRDEGESWGEIARHLPTILSVETLERA
jgi:photosystem II stability/assembly factor-like uncharacterized protein